MTRAALALAVLALAACSSAPRKTPPPPSPQSRIERPGVPGVGPSRHSPYAPAQEDVSKRGHYTRGGLYAPEIQDSAPVGIPDVDQIPEPEVRTEPRSLYGNRSPYVVLGETYNVLDDPAQYDEIGLASFYGNKFHGRRTSNLEVYDMYAFSAAHKTLPLPSYARVTNLANGRSVIVRVNDRGPFHEGRIIDLSYAAAVKLGVDRAGTARVEVKGLSPGENAVEPTGRVAARPDATRPIPMPARTHVATGIAATVRPSRPAGSAIDTLIDALPIASANASERPPQATGSINPNPAGERFDMTQNGRSMSATEFDAWMRERQLHVATGKAGVVATGTAPVAATPGPAPAQPEPGAAFVAGDVYQIASFGERINAQHALGLLTGAGIATARVEEADSGGRKVYRLRVGPLASDAVSELTAHLQGLGFGQPQRVHE